MVFGYDRKKKLRELALKGIEMSAYRKEKGKMQTIAIARAKKMGRMKARGIREKDTGEGKPLLSGIRRRKYKVKKFSGLF